MVWSRRIHLFIAFFMAISIRDADAQQSRILSLVSAERLPQEFRDSNAGITSAELVRRAIASNADLAASRLEVERARGRLRQSRLLPNPTLDVEQTTGRWTGSAGEKEQSVGVSFPIELGGKRGKRVDLAEADLAAAEADVADRERRLAADVRGAFADAMMALRDLEITSEQNGLDRQTVQFVQARVSEGDTPPLELNLLRADADRLRSKRALVQGQLEAAILKLKSLAGISPGDLLRFREDLGKPLLLPEPPSLEIAMQTALAARPDLRFARLTEEVAEAGLKLARAQAVPDIVLSTRYTKSSAVFDDTPVGVLRDKDKLFSFGASISIPVFNRNQGGRAEADASILQARRRREFIEALIASEVNSAYSRYLAAKDAVAIFEPGVIARSEQNIQAVRGAYEVGAFRITDLLNEQRRAVDFQREYTEALAEQYRALADLHAAMGTPIN